MALARSAAPDPVFIVGCSRSGTTVTYETIATSPRLLSFGREIPEFWESLWGPQTNWESEAAGAEDAPPGASRRRAALLLQRLGPGQVLDKTCINVMRVPYLRKLFPKARFVYIHRDGRDNVSSLMDGWLPRRAFRPGQAPRSVSLHGLDRAGEFKEWSFFLPPGWRAYNNAARGRLRLPVAERESRGAGRIADVPPGQWIQLRYEDIFDRPVEMFREVFARLDLPFDDAIQRLRDAGRPADQHRQGCAEKAEVESAAPGESSGSCR